VVATGALGGLAASLGPSLLRLPGAAGGGFEALLVTVCEAVLLGCGAWLWAATGVVLLDAARGRVRGRRGVPAGLRRLVLAACGVTLAGLIAAPGHAGPAAPALPAEPSPGGHGSAALVQGLPLPDRASAVGHVARLLLRRTPDPAPARVLVRPGDTLWGLAASRLPDTAGDAAVDAAWRRLYRANRPAIGPDPDLIHPGQRLGLPH
jgi:hypothetical protein